MSDVRLSNHRAAHPLLAVAPKWPSRCRLLVLQRGQRLQEDGVPKHGIVPFVEGVDGGCLQRRYLLVGERGPVAQRFRPLQRRR